MNKNLTEKYAAFDNLEEIILKREYKRIIFEDATSFLGAPAIYDAKNKVGFVVANVAMTPRGPYYKTAFCINKATKGDVKSLSYKVGEGRSALLACSTVIGAVGLGLTSTYFGHKIGGDAGTIVGAFLGGLPGAIMYGRMLSTDKLAKYKKKHQFLDDREALDHFGELYNKEE